MGHKVLCDFVNDRDTRVRIEGFSFESKVVLAVGGRYANHRATLNREQIEVVRDALSEFLEQAEKVRSC